MEMQKNVISYLSSLVAIDSSSSKDNSPVISLLQEWFKDYPQEIQEWTREVDGVKGKNLVVKIPGMDSKSATVFICHLDTVPSNDEWETDPFILEEQAGNLYGLGACDTKGGIAALIQGVLSLTDKPKRDTYIVFNGDEENTGTGIEKFLKKISIPHPQFIALEPTDDKLLITQRAIVKFKITTHGVPQHSSKATPIVNDRDNAIHKMAKIMIELEKDALDLSKEEDTLLGTHTQNFGVISGGTAHNVIPDSCTLIMHRRLLPNRDATKELDVVRELIQKVDPEAEIQLIGAPELGFATPKDSPFVRQILSLAKQTISSIDVDAFIAWSEAGATSTKGESVILGPGSINQAHRANEYINAQELFHYVEIYKNILTGLTG